MDDEDILQVFDYRCCARRLGYVGVEEIGMDMEIMEKFVLLRIPGNKYTDYKVVF